MSHAPNLLNDDGTASMATLWMLSHHGLRRDLGRFVAALGRAADADRAAVAALREEWQSFRETLHGHHEMEDRALFPTLAEEGDSLRATVEKLGADHRRIDPLLERGDRAFASLPRTDEALGVVRELRELLLPHLAMEEAELVSFLRQAKHFPSPETEEAAVTYAEGFAWAMNGVAPEVVERVREFLPANLSAKLPAAVRAFAVRSLRVWGTAGSGASRTPIPES
jgi:hemerythrin-like domain-containing protein